MVPGPVAHAILHSATLHLQRSNALFAGKNLVIGKFGEELLKQTNSTSSQQPLSVATQVGVRPTTFIPGTAEGAAPACAKNTTSKRCAKKKRHSGTCGDPTPSSVGKR